jgi:hypothetical protein
MKPRAIPDTLGVEDHRSTVTQLRYVIMSAVTPALGLSAGDITGVLAAAVVRRGAAEAEVGAARPRNSIGFGSPVAATPRRPVDELLMLETTRAPLPGV